MKIRYLTYLDKLAKIQEQCLLGYNYIITTETQVNTFENLKSYNKSELFNLEPNKQYTVFFIYIQHAISLILIIDPFLDETIEDYLDRISDLILLKINRIYQVDNHGFTILPGN